MKKFNVVNYHITNRCNYNCTYCFGKFCGQKDPSLNDANLNTTPLFEILKTVPMDSEKFSFRYTKEDVK